MSVKRASDILSSLWGGTEKRIAEMFSSAEKDGDILFLDECDSLFKPRGGAEYSWMVSETNELLTQMERFKGVLICATNFVENIDRAALRRFHLKVKFEDLPVEKLASVYKTFFASLLDKGLSASEKASLESITNLNPGDFKAVYNAILFKKNLSNEEIISRLRDEVSYKCKRKNNRTCWRYIMKKDDDYRTLVEMLKKSKEKRKKFIRCVDRIKECEKNLKSLNHERRKKDQDSMNDLIGLLESAIKESRRGRVLTSKKTKELRKKAKGRAYSYRQRV